MQGNRGDLTDWAPRIGIAWGIGGKSNRPAKTVLRAGAGIFYDRIPLAVTLNALRYNGAAQESFLIPDPTFFPAIPAAGELQANQQPQQLRQVFASIRAPRMFQSSLGIERPVSKAAPATVTWIDTRGWPRLNSRHIN